MVPPRCGSPAGSLTDAVPAPEHEVRSSADAMADAAIAEVVRRLDISTFMIVLIG
jgi:hypothetical protein